MSSWDDKGGRPRECSPYLVLNRGSDKGFFEKINYFRCSVSRSVFSYGCASSSRSRRKRQNKNPSMGSSLFFQKTPTSGRSAMAVQLGATSESLPSHGYNRHEDTT